jgi:hypothetical protein
MPQIYINGNIENVTAESIDAGPDGITAIVDAHGTVTIHSGKISQ